MVIVHRPNRYEIEEGCGFWAVVGPVREDFNPQGLPMEVVTADDISEKPFRYSQIRYWEGSDEEIGRLVRTILPKNHNSADIGRALF